MTTADRPGRRWLIVAAHHRAEISGLWFAVILLNAVWPDSWFGGALIALVGPPFVIAAFGELHHRAILCEDCMARFPLDGSERAERNGGWLCYFHFVRPVAMVFGLGACTAQLLTHNQFFLVVGAAELAISAYGMKLHQRLEPWCPWCRRNGDDDDFEPVPTPVLDGYKT